MGSSGVLNACRDSNFPGWRSAPERSQHWYEWIKADSLVVFVLLVLAQGGPQTAHAATNLIVSGTVRCDYLVDGKISTTRTNHCVVKLSGCKYSILLDAGNWQDRTTSIECVFDGANNYLSRRFSTNQVAAVWELGPDGNPRRRELKEPIKPKNDADLRIGAGPMPPAENIPITCIWLALASGCHYRDQPVSGFSELPLVFLGAAYQRFDIRLPTRFVMDRGGLELLAWREDYHDGKSYNLMKDRLEEQALDWKVDDHYTNSTFRVDEFTNWSGLRLPKAFSLTVNAPNSSRRTIETRVICRGIVEEVAMLTDVSEISPVVLPNTTVRDARPGIPIPADQANYFLKDGRIPAVTEVERKIRETQPSTLSQEIAFRVSRTRTLVLVSCFLISICFAYLFLRRRSEP